ncbi:zinc-dependent metalloprotease family protein [Paraglaciecola sp. 20A4]|uniref:zinc-dependent metalloprotease family protein n=1 Tax=Paraglaciecola sp. 20A4 TaxID=2687288 RepID=UPI00140AA77F|nr:zinc-dependent metalloprotease family protein [Paraglaciecola sp. 20A4]
MRILIFLLTILLSANNAQSIETTNLKIFANDDFKTIPVRVYIVKADKSHNLNAEISHNEAVNVFNIVNIIWRQAGIHFEIESIVNLQASNEDQYIAARKRKDRKMKVMRDVCDIPKQSKGVLNLCVVGQMSNNSGGVSFKSTKPKVVWPIALRNGKKPLNPATLAHEFGHFLGLPHNTEKDIFLMRGSGNNMLRNKQFNTIQLTESEIVKARKMAIKLFH